MNHHLRTRLWVTIVTLISLASLFIPLAQAKSREKDKKEQQLRAAGIYLISHLPLPEMTVSNIAAASDPNRQLLQLTDATHKTLTVVDVTKPAQPKLLEHYQLPVELALASLQVRIGDVALFGASEGNSSADTNPQSIALVSLADPSHPKTVQKFDRVTAVWSDRGRELIYLANADGLWILEVYSAADKRAEEQFDEMLRGSRSGG
ncbi:MAG TPA: hypothetical protein VE135_10050 [Pyrinomonadaceae bacterium]|jgi:hypothetical protein|nr:hypothetical protein [Pyrinomonadaceae bacterium]